MPTLSNLNIPTPKSWDEFEEITLDALKIKWENQNLHRNGRTGQPQAGVDIFGEDYFGFSVGVQCKKYDSGIDLKIINSEIENAENFLPKLEMFYLATTAGTDVTLQKEIRIISKKRKDAGKFPVGIFFWNDLVQELITNETIFKKHFPQFNIGENRKSAKRLFSILDISFHGLSIQHYSEVLYGEFGYLAGENPKKMEVIFSVIEAAALVVCDGDLQKRIKTTMNEYIDYVIPVVTGSKPNPDFHWKVANDIADHISGLITSVEHTLNSTELLVYRIGAMLANWNTYEFNKQQPDKPISIESQEKIRNYIIQLNNGALPTDIEAILEKYKSGESWVQVSIADNIYNMIRRKLIDAEIAKV